MTAYSEEAEQLCPHGVLKCCSVCRDEVVAVCEHGNTPRKCQEYECKARAALPVSVVEYQSLPETPGTEPGTSPAEGGNSFMWLQRRELERSREKHPKPISSVHAAYGILVEEVEEFWDEVKDQQRNRAKMAEELVQVAAVCQRAFEELGLWKDFRPS